MVLLADPENSMSYKRLQRRSVGLLLAMLLSFFFALITFIRGVNFDHDFENYSDLLDGLKLGGSVCFNYPSVEPLFSCLLYVLSPLEIHGALFFITWAALWLKFYVAARFGLSVILLFVPLYVTSFFMVHELNQTRLALSLSFLYGMFFLRFHGNATMLGGTFAVVSAFMVHYSAIIAGLLSMINPRRLNFYLYSFFFGGILYIGGHLGLYYNLLEVLGDERLFGYFKELSEGAEGDLNFINFATLLYMLCGGVVAVPLIFHKNKLSYTGVYQNYLFMLGVSFFCYYFFRGAPVIATRLAEISRAFTPIVLSILFCDCYLHCRKSAKLIFLSICMLAVGFFFLYGASVKPINDVVFKALGIAREL